MPTIQASFADRAAMSLGQSPMVFGSGDTAVGVIVQRPSCHRSATRAKPYIPSGRIQPSWLEANDAAWTYADWSGSEGTCAASVTAEPSQRRLHGWIPAPTLDSENRTSSPESASTEPLSHSPPGGVGAATSRHAHD